MLENTDHKTWIQQYFISIYFAIFGVGLINFTRFLSRKVYEHIDFSPILSNLFDWAAYFDHEKLPQLLHYLFTLIAFIPFFILFVWLTHSAKPSPIVDRFLINKKAVLWFLIGITILNVSGSFIKEPIDVLNMVWFLAFLSVPTLYLPSNFDSIAKKLHQNKPATPKQKTIFLLFALGVMLQFFIAFSPLMFGAMRIANDYLDIPEKTILQNGVHTDNTAYINHHKIGGFVKYDPRVDHGVSPMFPKSNVIYLSPNSRLKNFISSKGRKYRYTYDDDTHMLTLSNRAMTPYEYKTLSEIYVSSPENQESIRQLYDSSLNAAHLQQTRVYTEEESDFIAKNKTELAHQVKAGWFLFHHSWVLNPINAVSLGADFSKQTVLYGLLSTLSLKKLMELSGGISYQTYFKISYMFYPLYFLMFLAIIFSIFKRIEYVCIAAVLFSSSMLLIGDQLIQLAPGFNPLRHFFDMSVFLLFYLYTDKNKASYLYASLLLAMFSILWSKDFGVFLFLSIVAVVLVQQFTAIQRKKRDVLLTVGIALAGLGLYILPIHGKNPNVVYMLLGLTIPNTSTMLTSLILCCIGVGYFFYIKCLKKHNAIFYLSFSLFIYCQLELIYFVWFPSFHHLLSIAAPFVFLLLTFYALWEQKNLPNRSLTAYRTFHKGMVLGLLGCIYFPSLCYFYQDRAKLEYIFLTHKVYDWTFKHATFKTTMDPELFQQSIDLIHKYEEHPGIYLVSKYDAILPMLSHTYNLVPAVSVALDLISRRDLERMLAVIRENKPEYLFVDTDIMRNYNNDIFHANDPLARKNGYLESVGRASIMDNLRSLYIQVKDAYEPIEEGKLITILKLRRN
ncbi:MAG: hypothetical protein CK424_03050 [Legionella sp.]|nr:MAG: hypothetical protein CK424_03050 [Legionella sp.]